MKNLSLFFLLLFSIGIYSCKNCPECLPCSECPDYHDGMRHPELVCMDTVILSTDITDITDISLKNDSIKHITFDNQVFYCFSSDIQPHIITGQKVNLCRYNYHISKGEYGLKNDLKGTFWVTTPTTQIKDFGRIKSIVQKGQAGCNQFNNPKDIIFQTIAGDNYLKMKMHYHKSDTVFYPEYYKISISEKAYITNIATLVFNAKKTFGVGVDKLPDLIVGTSSSRENAHNTIKLVVDLDN